ncbi:MAG: ASCH domain-containing protein [Desulfobacteraceae bacterium]|nr:ASCH domain-containing protein [Desulfobacteraceae bacterium]MBU4010108.1 ASCH domain-containing protein [Pseudomonadota bacterium]MBU4054527.1 ASCH domain-containing protein [Pseudomonadota bacterium]
MPRNISFALTTEQFINKSKTVTRRLGWKFLKPGDVLMGCKKCMGLRHGEKIERLGLIRVTDVRSERLNQITDEDVVKEGFPDINRSEFIKFFIDEMNTKLGVLQPVTRIEFEYL